MAKEYIVISTPMADLVFIFIAISMKMASRNTLMDQMMP